MTEYHLKPWAEALSHYGPAWLDLGKSNGLNLSLLPDWTRIVVECVTDATAVSVLAGVDHTTLTGLVPFQIRGGRISGIPVRILEPISSTVAYHAEFVSRDSPIGLLRALVHTREELPWDLMRLTGVVCGSPTEKAILEVARADSLSLIRWPGEESPYLPLGITGEKLVASRDKRDRYLIRKHIKDLAAQPGGMTTWYSKGSSMEELLAAMLHVEAGSWKQRAGVAISGNPHEMNFYRRLLPWLADNGHLVASVVLIAGEPVAYCLCYVWQGSYGCIKGTYREEFTKLAVGHLAMDELILRAADAGGTEFDFLGDADPYKLAWSPTTRQHADYFLYSPRGKGHWLGLAQRARQKLLPRRNK